MSLESTIEGLDRAVDSLDDAVRDQSGEVGRLAVSVKELAEIVRDSFNADALKEGRPISISNNFMETSAGKARAYSGFDEGDEVVFINSIYKHGLRARVKFHPTRPFNDGEVPVVRSDNNMLDVFPARGTILASNLGHYEPIDVPFYKGDPEGTQTDWNLRVLEAAAEDGFAVKFTYEKPPGRYSWEQTGDTEARTVTVTRVERMGPQDLDTIIAAYDANKGEPRNFRLDRIKSYVQYAEEAPS